MWEKYEKWWILGILAVVIYYFYKKGTASTAAAPSAPADFSGFLSDFMGSGSIVNTASEAGAINPASSTRPIVFNPAQPSTVPISQRISAGQFAYINSPPALRLAPGARMNYLA